MSEADQTLAVLTEDLSKARDRMVSLSTGNTSWAKHTATAQQAYDLRADAKAIDTVLAALTAREEEAGRLREGINRAIRLLSDKDEHEHARILDARDVLILTRDHDLREVLSAALHAPQPQGIGSPTGDA